jgi:outer membrane protein OmpA-like peptidoglycan-associated protein
MRRLAHFTLTFCLLVMLASCKTQAQGGKPKPSDYGIKSKKALDLYEEGRMEAHDHRDYQQAIMLYREAIALEPGFGEAYFQAGACAHARQDYPLAYEFLIKAKEIIKDPNPMLYYFLGNASLSEGKYDEAAKNYDALLALNPPLSANDLKVLERNRKVSHFGAQAMKNPVKFEPENVGDNVNSIGEEYMPYLTADGQTVFFTARRPGCTGGYQAEFKDFTEDFYYSEMVDGKWQPCKNLGPPVNTDFNEGAPSFSPDGQYVFFASCGREGGYGSCDIYVSKLQGTTWSKPQNLGPLINTPAWESQPCISNDGKTLYFSSNRAGGLGSHDIWYANLVNGRWTEPKNMGAPVNSEGSEQGPFIHADDKTFYFSSDFHPGFGNYDLFISRATANGWSKPDNLGYPLNTSGAEAQIFVDSKGNQGFFASSRSGGLGKSDIYSFVLDERIRPDFTTYVRGTVSEKNTGKALDATVTFINVTSGDTIRSVKTNVASGRYMLTLPLEQDYAAFVDKKGYLFKSSLFSLKNVDPKTTPYFDVDIQLEPLSVGLEVIMSAIFYETNKFDLLDDSKPELDHMVSFLRVNKTLKVEIGGHTDNVGTDKENQVLSENRASEVRKYLISKGISGDRITSKGYGESQPMITNDTEEGRALNRRTVCRITEI